MRNLPITFDCMYCSQKLGEDFAKFCDLLRIYELYHYWHSGRLSYEIMIMQSMMFSTLYWKPPLIQTKQAYISYLSSQKCKYKITNNSTGQQTSIYRHHYQPCFCASTFHSGHFLQSRRYLGENYCNIRQKLYAMIQLCFSPI